MQEFDQRRQGLSGLKTMAMIRAFESRMPVLSEERLIRGSTHPSAGMEAVATGVSLALGPQDSIASNHRGHAHCLARGSDPGRTMAEILGRRDGYGGGKGGSMHIGVAELGILGTNGIVGAGIGLATGAALAAQMQGSDAVSVVYFGDGAANQGVLAEALNLAAIWKLPVLFVCENNHYAQSASIEEMIAQPDLKQRGLAYGVPSVDVDGMSLGDTFTAAAEGVERARSGSGPTLIIADTYRYLGHMAGDTEIYRNQVEVEQWQAKDPIARLVSQLLEAGVITTSDWEDIQEEASRVVQEAEEFARNSPFPDASDATQDVYSKGVPA
ncbi:thiamine pyrophosphate-dependent dehydrogenase E1 component subunit alpha [Arthrobacter castelli]|uniref:thiamine pyrophosphate-dependent dehydrogenase E1 component subunit alpha n=1 Tax=Arthrobacter castelli TaxID=271431 RepID=UPI000400F1B8|nr:thiamine pyrophosphate-dependent dehydrogenase E1 component subunit alpha [Arthrobacter castelli]